jgi:hypothetical protein
LVVAPESAVVFVGDEGDDVEEEAAERKDEHDVPGQRLKTNAVKE